MNLNNAMRQLWEDHITHTRNFIISSLGNLEDTGKVAERLLRNQDDIGNAIQPIYGEAAGKKLAALPRFTGKPEPAPRCAHLMREVVRSVHR